MKAQRGYYKPEDCPRCHGSGQYVTPSVGLGSPHLCHHNKQQVDRYLRDRKARGVLHGSGSDR